MCTSSKPRRLRARDGFSLLELVVVLTILALVTTLAMRSLDGVLDQQHYEQTQRGLAQLEAAVLGLEEERSSDGTRVFAGFVSDMGRHPKVLELPHDPTQAGGSGNPVEGTLGELWIDPGPDTRFALRSATEENGVLAKEDQDAQVLVPGGWRGPYLRLPIGIPRLQDAWGNAYANTEDTTPTMSRLLRRDGSTASNGQEIGSVRHFGSDGNPGKVDDNAFSGDGGVFFYGTAEGAVPDEIAVFSPPHKFQAEVAGQVEVLVRENNTFVPATPVPTDNVVVRIYSPDPTNPAKIHVRYVSKPFTMNPVTWQPTDVLGPKPITAHTPLTIGTRVVRAKYEAGGENPIPAINKSTVKTVVLRPGINVLHLTIDR